MTEDERAAVIRECISEVKAAAMNDPRWNAGRQSSVADLERLLHKDNAKTLAEEWWNGGNREGAGCWPSSQKCAEAVIRWLIARENLG